MSGVAMHAFLLLAVAEIPLKPGRVDQALKSLVVVWAQGVTSVELAPPLSAQEGKQSLHITH